MLGFELALFDYAIFVVFALAPVVIACLPGQIPIDRTEAKSKLLSRCLRPCREAARTRWRGRTLGIASHADRRARRILNAANQCRWLMPGLCSAAFAVGAPCAEAQSGIGGVYVNNFVSFQKNEDGSDQWTYEPRLYIPYQFDNGWVFTQRVDVPLIYTNGTGPGNSGGGWSGGIGDVLIQESFTSPQIAKNLQVNANLRIVFPTGKQSPFGSSQYQLAPGGGVIYQMPDIWYGVTLTPFVRYFFGFDPKYANVNETRELDLYPTATFALPERWSLLVYPENPITYNERNKAWFVPLDLMLARKIDKTFDFAIGAAWKLGNPSNPTYHYIIDARLIVNF